MYIDYKAPKMPTTKNIKEKEMNILYIVKDVMINGLTKGVETFYLAPNGRITTSFDCAKRYISKQAAFTAMKHEINNCNLYNLVYEDAQGNIKCLVVENDLHIHAFYIEVVRG